MQINERVGSFVNDCQLGDIPLFYYVCVFVNVILKRRIYIVGFVKFGFN